MSPIIFLSPIFVTSCNINNPKVNGNNIVKEIAGLHHSLEWDRFQSCVCTMFDQESMEASVRNGALSIGTRPGSTGKCFECL